MSPTPADLSYLARMNTYSCRYDPRLSYNVYVPKNWHLPPGEKPDRYKLVVLIHGNERGSELYRNSFRRFAEATDSVVLAPLFPAGIIEFDKLENYHLLRYKDIEFDTALINMISELNLRFPIETDKLFLHGFSAGGQFVHRFFYLYPEMIQGLSIGSTGWITLLDHSLPWPKGLSGFEEVFGRLPDIQKLRRVKVQMIVGGDDDFLYNPDSELTRMQLVRKLQKNFQDNAIETVFTVMPGVAHQGLKILPGVMDFFASVMGKPWDSELRKTLDESN